MRYPIKISNNLPFIKVLLNHKGRNMTLNNVLIDTGSANSIFKEEKVKEIGVKPEANDKLGTIRGVGGTEFVYIKNIDYISIGEVTVENFKVDIGEMDYGINLDGIIGVDFLMETKMIINLFENYLEFK